MKSEYVPLLQFIYNKFILNYLNIVYIISTLYKINY